MCGIIGVVGRDDPATILLEGLKRLEYRGYDSAGIATHDGKQIVVKKAVGKLSALESVLATTPTPPSAMHGIGHTRWATHGAVALKNAHPIAANDKQGVRVVVVHNGIIENYRQLRAALSKQGAVFTSDTDSEVLAHLFVHALTDSQLAIAQTTQDMTEADARLLAATKQVTQQLEGAYAFVAMDREADGTLAIARQASPLTIGIDTTNSNHKTKPNKPAVYVGSDATALGAVTRQVIFLKDGDHGVITCNGFSNKNGIYLYDSHGKPASRESTIVAASPNLISKEGYQHFMEKEIHEQPDALIHTLAGLRPDSDKPGFAIDVGCDWKTLDGLALLAAGTSFHAALTARYWFEQLADLPVVAEIASEFRYRQPSLRHIGLAIGISQSGESLDTLMALRHAGGHAGGHAKNHTSKPKTKTAALVNVATSTMAREAEACVLTQAGAEIGVASTKSYMTQLAVLLAMAASAGHARGVIDKKRLTAIAHALFAVPRLIAQGMQVAEAIRPMVASLAQARSCLYLGRGALYPLALEGALKLKELSYIHAEGYAAGEMKHGPIALIEEGLPVVAVLAGDAQLPKAVSNLSEAKARGGEIFLLATESAAKYVADNEAGLATMTAVVADGADELGAEMAGLVAPMVLALPIQFLAYMVAVHKGTDVDQPRNLAKSVTVE